MTSYVWEPSVLEVPYFAAVGRRFPAWSLGLLGRAGPVSGRGQTTRPSDHPHQPAEGMGHLVTVICSPALNIATSPYLFVGQSASGSASSVPRSDKYG